MNDWKEIKLKELIQEIGDGGTPSTFNPDNFGKGIPWVVVDDIKPEIWTTKEELTQKGFESCSSKKWPIGSIILSTGATIGEVGIAKVELCTKQGITGIIPNKYADNIFLRYWFEQNKNQLIRYAQGTTFKEIRPRTLGNLRIKIPKPFTEDSVSEQRKIASILTKVDDAIQAVKNTIEKAERLKKSLMQNLLTGKLKPDGSWRTEDEFYIDEKFGKVPVGWEVKRIKDITINLDSQRKPIKAEDRKNMQGHYPYYGAAGIIDWVNDFIFDGTFILFGEDGENLLSRKLPQSFIVSSKIWVNNHAHILQEIPEIVNIHFLCYQLENKDYRSIVYGSAQPKINQNDLNKIKVLIPNEVAEQEKIVEKIKSIEKLLFIKQQKIQKLERLKKALMQNLLTGKVRVKV